MNQTGHIESCLGREELEVVLKFSQMCNSTAKVINSGNAGDVKGQYYSSSATREKLKILRNDGTVDVRYIFVKEIPSNKFARDYVLSNGVCGKEIKMYREVLPIMENLMRSSGDYSDLMWAKFVGNYHYDALLLEDLISQGFKRLDSRVGLDLDHSIIAFRSLAKYHALSVILINKQLIDLFSLRKVHYIKKLEIRERRLKAKFRSIVQVIKEYCEPKFEKFAVELEDIIEDIMNKLIRLTERDECAFSVLNHGDSWTSNLLFKYAEFTSQVIGMKFVDFQVSHYNSYAFDIQYILHTSVQSRVRNVNYMELLEAYYETLTATFHRYNYTPSNLPSMEDVVQEVQSKLFYGIITSIHLLELMQAGPSDHVTSEAVLGKLGSIPQDGMKTENYINKLQSIIEPYLDLNLSSL